MIGCRKGRWYSSKCGVICDMGTWSRGTIPPRLARCYRPCGAFWRLRDKSPPVEIFGEMNSPAGYRMRWLSEKGARRPLHLPSLRGLALRGRCVQALA